MEGWPDKAVKLGANVPACVLSRACIGTGTVIDLGPIKNHLAGPPVLLVNPRLPVPIGPVFKAWDGVDCGAVPTGSLCQVALTGRNDLKAPAIGLYAPLADVLAHLSPFGAFLARISESSATCFALYDDAEQLAKAAASLTAAHLGWWQMAGKLP